MRFCLRTPFTARAACLLGAALLTLLLGLLCPIPTLAKQTRRGRASARKPAVHRNCTPKRPAKPSKAKRSSKAARSAALAKQSSGRAKQACAKPHKAKKSPFDLHVKLRELEATPLDPILGPLPPPSSETPPPWKHERPAPPSGPLTGNLPIESGEVVNDPIDPRFLTDVPFGKRSFWIQPWRSYLDTWPASRLLDGLGINFNVNPADAEATAQLLQDSGFKLARIPIDWAALSYSEPTKFTPGHLSEITARLSALHNHGLRPLIVLDAYSGAPTPEKLLTLETTAPAAAGAQTVTLSPASAARVVPGKTGFNDLSFGGSPDILIASVGAGDVATLSRPLLNPLAAGGHPGTTLLYAPFGPPKLADGRPNPEFQATMAGWLNYVAQVCKVAAGVVGPGGFDLEIWNELTFQSQFLDAEHYYSSSGVEASAHASSSAQPEGDPQASASSSPQARAEAEATPGPEAEVEGDYRSEAGHSSEAEYGSEPEGDEGENPEAEGPEGEGSAAAVGDVTAASETTKHKPTLTKEVTTALRGETVDYVRNPANGISPEVGITDGFASETPFPSGAGAPVGLTALSKHPYVNARNFPADFREGHVYPLNATGARDTESNASFKPLFTPTYQSLMPEYTLGAVSTETLVRDLSPLTSEIYGLSHGREVGPAGGNPVQKWITEYNLGTGGAQVLGPDQVTPASGPSATLTAADRAHFEAKTLLRSLVAMISKGVSREYFFAAAPGPLSLIGEGFFSALEAHPGAYPGDQLGGETMSAFRNLVNQLQGPGPSGTAQQLKLLSIAQEGNHAQFSGDGTPAHPNLYDRDVLAVFPFQSSPTHFVIPVYVMSENLLTLYEPNAPQGDIHRFDLPNENFRITLGNLPDASAPPSVSAYDPLSGEPTPARMLSREGSTATFEIAASDYPRLLNLEY